MTSKTSKTRRPRRKAVTVVRVSKMGGRKNDAATGERFRSGEFQIDVTDGLARRYDLNVVETFEDYDVSGGTMDRPGLNAALQMVEDGKADTILVAKLDRFARNTKGALETLERIEEHGGSLICGDMDVDTSTPMGRMIFTQAAAMAQMERDKKGDELASAAAAATREGIRIAPPPPGYLVSAVKRLVPDPEREHLIPELFRRRADGHSWSEIRDWWHGETGEWLKAGRLHKMIQNRTYLGELTYGDAVSGVAHKALVDEELFDAAQGVAAPRPAKARKPKALLAGIIKCGGCGRNMTVSVANNRTIYRCQKVGLAGTKCKHPVAVMTSRADEWVEEAFLQWAGEASAITTGELEPDFEAAEAAIVAAQRELDSFMAAFSSVVGIEQATQAAQERKDAVDAAIAKRDELYEQRKVAGIRFKVVDHWNELTVEEKRRMLMAGIESVVVQPTSPTPSGGRPRIPFGDRAVVTWRAD